MIYIYKVLKQKIALRRFQVKELKNIIASDPKNNNQHILSYLLAHLDSTLFQMHPCSLQSFLPFKSPHATWAFRSMHFLEVETQRESFLHKFLFKSPHSGIES